MKTTQPEQVQEDADLITINAYEIEDEDKEWSIFKSARGSMAITPRDKGIIFMDFPMNKHGDFVIPRNLIDALIPFLTAYAKGEFCTNKQTI